MLYDQSFIDSSSRFAVAVETDFAATKRVRVLVGLEAATSTTHSRSVLSKRFDKFADQWLAETRFTSSPTEKYLHVCYARIIGMGPDAVPFILRRLKKHPADWFYALRAITGDNPVTDDMAGDMPRMREAWLNWGKVRNLVDGAKTEALEEDFGISESQEINQRRNQRR